MTSRIMFLAVFAAAQGANAAEPVDPTLPAECSEIYARHDQLREEAAIVEAHLASQCAPRSNRTGVGITPLLTASDQSTDVGRVYATHCWEAGSAFADRSCNCFGEPAHPKLYSRRTIKIVVGSW
jgi:hypothetical protein